MQLICRALLIFIAVTIENTEKRVVFFRNNKCKKYLSVEVHTVAFSSSYRTSRRSRSEIGVSVGPPFKYGTVTTPRLSCSSCSRLSFRCGLYSINLVTVSLGYPLATNTSSMLWSSFARCFLSHTESSCSTCKTFYNGSLNTVWIVGPLFHVLYVRSMSGRCTLFLILFCEYKFRPPWDMETHPK